MYNGENPVIYFSIAKGTDISAEIHPDCKLLIAADGIFEVFRPNDYQIKLNAGDMVLMPAGLPFGMKTAEGSAYTEISVRKEGFFMNEAVKPGEVFKLAKLVPYIEGKIVNMDVVHNNKMKFIVMAFDEGTVQCEHAAPERRSSSHWTARL